MVSILCINIITINSIFLNRHAFASMHLNENLHCEAREKKDGSKCSQVTYPELKLGESVARDVACAPTYGNFQNAISNYKAGFGRYFQVTWGGGDNFKCL